MFGNSSLMIAEFKILNLNVLAQFQQILILKILTVIIMFLRDLTLII